MSRVIELVTTWTFVLFQLFAFIASCVVFGAELVSSEDNDAKGSWKWNQFVLSFSGTTSTFPYTSDGSGPLHACYGSGKGALAFAVLSFLLSFVAMPLSIARAIGKDYVIPRLGEDPALYTKVEYIIAGVQAFFFFLICTIFGGGCFKAIKDDTADNADVKATGFAFVAVTCAFLFVNLCLYYLIRTAKLYGGNTSTDTGAGAAKEDPHRAAFASVYNQTPADGPIAGGADNNAGAVPEGAPAAAQGGAVGGAYQTF